MLTSLEEVKTSEGKFLGTRIIRDGCTYIARNWELTEEVKDILETSCRVGIINFGETIIPLNLIYWEVKNTLMEVIISRAQRNMINHGSLPRAESLSSHSGKQRVRS